MSKNCFLDLLHSFIYVYMPVEKGLSDNTQRSYKQTFKLFVEYMYEELNIIPDKITFEIIDRDVVSGFLDWIEIKRGCGPKTRNQRLAALSSFSDYVQRINFDTVIGFRRAVLSVEQKKSNNSVKSFFTKEEVRLLLELPKTGRFALRDQTLFVFMYASGARAQEVCDLKIKDITFEESKAYVELNGKGKKVRRIAIPKGPAEMIKKYIDHSGRRNSKNDYVFKSLTHDQMTISCVEEIYRKYIAILKTRYPDRFSGNYSPHSMRHTTATHMVEAGVPLIVIKNFLGHSSVQTTQIYAKISQSQLDEQTRKWNETWLSPISTEGKKEIVPDFLR